MSSESLPHTWMEARLDEICEVILGQSPPGSSYNTDGIGLPFFQGSAEFGDLFPEVRKWTTEATKVAQARDVLLSVRAPVGPTNLAPLECAIGRGVAALRAVAGVEPKYLLYAMRATEASLAARGTGSTFSAVSGPTVREHRVPLAPTAEQRRIVAAIEEYFSRIDAGVEALQRARWNLKRMRATVLYASVTGQLLPQDPQDEPAELLVKRVLEERRATWNGGRYREPTAPDLRGLPTLPSGWAWATIEQVSMRVTVGHVGPMKNEYVADGVPFLRSQNVRENRFDPSGLVYISREFHERLSKSRLQPGDLVIVRSGSVGTACVVPETLPEANCADLVVVQRPLGIDPRFGAYYMNSLARKYVHSEQVGVALTHFNTRSAASLPIPVPPLSEQARIVEAVERFLSVIGDLETTVGSVSLRERHLRQSAMTSAFAGRLAPQDSSDEPASALLERIRITRGVKDSRPSHSAGIMRR